MENSDELEEKLIEVAKMFSEFLHFYMKLEKESILAYIQHLFEVRDSVMAHASLEPPAEPVQAASHLSRQNGDFAAYEDSDDDWDIEDWDVPTQTNGEPPKWEDINKLLQVQSKRFEHKVLRLFSSMFMAKSVADIDIMMSVFDTMQEKWDQTFNGMETMKLTKKRS